MHMQAQPFILIFLAGHYAVLSTWQKQQDDIFFSLAGNRLIMVVLERSHSSTMAVLRCHHSILPTCVQHVPVGGAYQEKHR